MMKGRVFFILSLLLAITALAAQLWAMGFTGRSAHMRARAITGPSAERARVLDNADDHQRQFPVFYYSGWAAAMASAALLIVSFRRREPVRRSIPIGLLAGYGLLQLFMIELLK